MCGLAGTAALTGVLAPEVRVSIRAMTDAISHRGPDGEGFFTDHVVSARAPPAGDHRPRRRPSADGQRGRHLLDRLQRRDLQPPRAAGTSDCPRPSLPHRSDTETILHAYEEFGADCLDCLEGMFAFAIYDQRRRELLLARDRLGKKPLFYAVFDGVLHFASEIKALQRARCGMARSISSSSKGICRSGTSSLPPPSTATSGSSSRGIGCECGTASSKCRKYWDVEQFDDGRAPSRSGRARSTSCCERGARRLESEVPLGAFLSGGIDSGLVVSYMAERPTAAVVTTTVGFGEAAHNELDAGRPDGARFQTNTTSRLSRRGSTTCSIGIVRRIRRAVCRRFGLPTCYVSRGAAARDGRAERRWRRRSVRRLQLPLRAACHGTARAGPAAWASSGRAAGRVGAAWPRGRMFRGRCVSARTSRISVAIPQAPITPTCAS